MVKYDEMDFSFQLFPSKALLLNKRLLLDRKKAKAESLMACSKVSGNYKLKLMFTSNMKNHIVCYKNQKITNMNLIIFNDWFFEQFDLAVEKLLK